MFWSVTHSSFLRIDHQSIKSVEREREREREMSERNEERRENVCMKKSKHINNLVEVGEMEKAMSAARDMMNRGIEPD